MWRLFHKRFNFKNLIYLSWFSFLVCNTGFAIIDNTLKITIVLGKFYSHKAKVTSIKPNLRFFCTDLKILFDSLNTITKNKKCIKHLLLWKSKIFMYNFCTISVKFLFWVMTISNEIAFNQHYIELNFIYLCLCHKLLKG